MDGCPPESIDDSRLDNGRRPGLRRRPTAVRATMGIELATGWGMGGGLTMVHVWSGRSFFLKGMRETMESSRTGFAALLPWSRRTQLPPCCSRLLLLQREVVPHEPPEAVFLPDMEMLTPLSRTGLDETGKKTPPQQRGLDKQT